MEINKIYNEDCLETMKCMPDNFVDCIITSPPYDDLKKYNGFVFDFKAIAKELYRIIKEGCVLVWIVNDRIKDGSETGTSFRQALYFKEVGFNLHNTMIWNKTNPMPQIQYNRYSDSFEYMFILSKGKVRNFNPILIDCKDAGNNYNYTAKHPSENKERVKKDFVINNKKKLSNVWNVAVSKSQAEHPAIFPQKLIDKHIISWSNKNYLIYDCFMGSGTTALSCIKYNRNFIGSEISKEYCDAAMKRIEQHKQQLRLL